MAVWKVKMQAHAPEEEEEEKRRRRKARQRKCEIYARKQSDRTPFNRQRSMSSREKLTWVRRQDSSHRPFASASAFAEPNDELSQAAKTTQVAKSRDVSTIVNTQNSDSRAADGGGYL